MSNNRGKRYTNDDGDAIYEKEGEQGFPYEEDGVPFSYSAAAALQSLSIDEEPRSQPPVRKRSGKVKPPVENENYGYEPGPSGSRAADEAEDEEGEDQDKPGPLPPGFDGDNLPALKASGPADSKVKADLASSHLSTHSRLSTPMPMPSDYEVKDASFFQVGKVFRYHFAEAMGVQGQAKVQAQTLGTANNSSLVFETLRPMVVVIKLEAHAVCVPIFTHGGKGVGKPGLKAKEVARHAVVHMEGRSPELVAAEKHWASKGKISTDDAFTLHPARGVSLDPASRIRFDYPYTVKYNLPVLEVGTILRAHRARLFERWLDAYTSK